MSEMAILLGGFRRKSCHLRPDRRDPVAYEPRRRYSVRLQFELVPGMPAKVLVVTGERTMAKYLL